MWWILGVGAMVIVLFFFLLRGRGEVAGDPIRETKCPHCGHSSQVDTSWDTVDCAHCGLEIWHSLK